MFTTAATASMAPPLAGAGMRRAIGAVAALAAAGVLGLAAWFEPSPAGLGTHRQIVGMPECGWIRMFDCPCPTCGMTTSFAHAADGNLLASLLAQPLGFALALATAVTLLVGAHTAVTGSRLPSALARLWSARMAWGLAAFALLAWAFKILSYKGLL